MRGMSCSLRWASSRRKSWNCKPNDWRGHRGPEGLDLARRRIQSEDVSGVEEKTHGNSPPQGAIRGPICPRCRCWGFGSTRRMPHRITRSRASLYSFMRWLQIPVVVGRHSHWSLELLSSLGKRSTSRVRARRIYVALCFQICPILRLVFWAGNCHSLL
jgi:hypothetical protein